MDDPADTGMDWLVEQVAGSIDPARRTPLYEQVIAAIEALVERGALPAGAVLPPEPAFATRLGLSRQTVNQALTTLSARGVVVRRRGIGTFVAPPTIEQPLDGLYSFIRTLTAQGARPGSTLLGTRITTDDAASSFLTGRPDGLVFELSRLRLWNDEPVVVELLYLNPEDGDALPRERLTTDVIYDLLREARAIEVTYADETMQPVAAPRTEAALLGVIEGEPAFLVERRAYAGERPIELRRSLIRGDRFRFRARLAASQLRDEPAAAGD